MDGVYTTDPRIVPRARKLEKIAYEEMAGTWRPSAPRCCTTRSVELAMKERVRVQVLSSFEAAGADHAGTLLVDEDEIVEKEVVTASPMRATKRR